MASILKRETSSGVVYRVSWRVGAGKDRRPETKTFKTKEEARRHKREVEEKIESRRVGSLRRISVFEYLDEWIAEKAADRKRPVSPKTVEGYLRNIEIAKRGLKVDRPLSQLETAHVNKAYDALLENGKLMPGGATAPLTAQTVLHVHRVLHKAFADAVKPAKKLIAVNPASGAEPPRVQGKKYKTKVRPFTKDETVLLFKRAQDPVCDPETYPIAATLAVTGLRRGELAGLADDAVDWERGVLTIFRNVVEVDGKVVVKSTKSEAGNRELKIPAELVALLRAQRARVLATALAWGKGYQREPLYLFPGVGGEAMHPKLITRRMERLIKRAKIVPGEGKKISPVHSWRHTTGSMLWRQFKDAKQIQGQLGHSTPSLTMQLYVENTVDAEDEASAFLGGLIR